MAKELPDELKAQARETLTHWLSQAGLPVDTHDPVTHMVLIGVAILVAFLAYLVAKGGLGKAFATLSRRLAGPWQETLEAHRVIPKATLIVPLVVLDLFTPLVFAALPWLDRMATQVLQLVVLVAVIRLLFALLDVAQDLVYRSSYARRVPMQSLVQLVKLFLFILAVILFISLLLDRSPLYLLSGLGVATGLLLLVFRDTILGFVAGIQLAVNGMVSRGDWIQMDKYGADGDVLEVSLTTVKVQNWDKTVTMIPAQAMVADSFKNWRGMQDSGGRRIKRAILLDLHSVRFLDERLEANLDSLILLVPYLVRKRKELARANRDLANPEQPGNGRRLTNLGCYRAYLAAYLQSHPGIHRGMTLMVRQLAPTDAGLPLEIYCFTNTTNWVDYEGIQADLFDHALAVLDQFDLRAMQQPTGADLRQWRQPGDAGRSAQG